MTAFVAIFAVGLLTLSCLGYGRLVIRVSGAHSYIADDLEEYVLAFVLGVGILGWLVFFPGISGYLSPVLFWIICLLGVGCAIAVWVRTGVSVTRLGFSLLELLLLALIVCVALIDVIEGISPPADADSLAYHFALPAEFLASGEISFVPRAVSGAIPLLLHMTYAAALATGGELALTLWVTITGWAAALLLFVMMRRHIPRVWALAVGLVFLTTPAILYGSGNGQTEVRCVLFVLAALAFMLSGQQEGRPALFLLAGLCAGFYVGAKYYGLIFAGAAGLVILFQRGGGRNGLLFASAALVAGFQWYFWNWLHTGDPVFPTLANLLAFPDTPFWTRDFGRYFAETMALGELPLERTVLNWLGYPVFSIFNLVEPLEGGRTGFGVFALLVLPMAVAGLLRPELRRREVVIPLVTAFVFFTVWFFSGTAQRSRHLLPIYPLVLLTLFPIALEVARRAALLIPLSVAVAATLTIQLAGQTVFGLNYMAYAFSDETREEFHERNVPGANSAHWLNREFTGIGRLGFMNRQLAYLLTSPRYMMHPHIQVVVDTRPTSTDGSLFSAQLQEQGMTHLLLPGDWDRPDINLANETPFFAMIGRLIRRGCLKQLRTFQTVHVSSRTLRRFGAQDLKTVDTFFEVLPSRCP